MRGLLVLGIVVSSVVVFLALLFMSKRIWSNMLDHWLETDVDCLAVKSSTASTSSLSQTSSAGTM